MKIRCDAKKKSRIAPHRFGNPIHGPPRIIFFCVPYWSPSWETKRIFQNWHGLINLRSVSFIIEAIIVEQFFLYTIGNQRVIKVCFADLRPKISKASFLMLCKIQIHLEVDGVTRKACYSYCAEKQSPHAFIIISCHS